MCDRPWSDHALRLAARCEASLACLHIPGHNSRRFLAVPQHWTQLRALLLIRELIRPACRHIAMRLASVYEPHDVQRCLRKANHPAARLRADCYWRADRDGVQAKPTHEAPEEQSPHGTKQLDPMPAFGTAWRPPARATEPARFSAPSRYPIGTIPHRVPYLLSTCAAIIPTTGNYAVS